MIIMGVDPGTRYLGYGVLEHKKQKTRLIESGCLDIHKKKKLTEKIGCIYKFAHEKAQEYNITVLALETPFLYKNASTFLKLGYVRGVLYLIADQLQFELREYAPTEIKQQVTGYGKASKDQVSTVVTRLFNIKKPQRDDTTDAIAIALCGLWNRV